MDKDFDRWNSIKKKLEIRSDRFLFKTGDVWWCSVGINIKTESCGKGPLFRRPVQVLKKLSANSFIGIPLTTKRKIGSWFTHVSMQNQVNYALLYQVKMFNTARLQRRLTTDFSI